MQLPLSRKSMVSIFAQLTVLAALAACSGQTTTQQAASESVAPPQEQVSDKPVLMVATDASNAPYEMRDEQGQVVGFDVDLINAIGAAQGFEVKILNQPWSGIFDTLDNGSRDVVMAPLTITEERKQTMSFTDPYIYPTRTAFLSKQTAEENKVKTFEDLRNLTIACKGQTTNESALREIFGQDYDKIIPESTQYLAFRDMINGKAQVAFGDTIVMRYHAIGDKTDLANFVQIDQPMQPKEVQAAFAVKKGNTALLEKLNAGLKQVRADGTYRKIAEKWFDPESAAKVSAQE